MGAGAAKCAIVIAGTERLRGDGAGDKVRGNGASGKAHGDNDSGEGLSDYDCTHRLQMRQYQKC